MDEADCETTEVNEITRFSSGQWRVVDGYILSVGIDAYEYWIGASDYLMRSENGEGSDWRYEFPLHVARKSWVNIDEFERAFRYAIQHEGMNPDIAKLDYSFTLAKRIAARKFAPSEESIPF